jgi:SAM-dependent methyltransferase
MKLSTSLERTVKSKWLNFSGAVGRARREDGLAAAFGQAARWIGDVIFRPVSILRQLRLDRRLGVRTRGERSGPANEPLDSEVIAAATYRDSIAYGPTPAHHFIRLLSSLPVDVTSDFTFVDIGCGKGLTLLLASDHGFQPVIGVELDPRLVDIARDNVQTFLAQPSRHERVIDVVQHDAADYEFPEGPTVAFMFHPFGESTLRAVVKNMERSLKRSPRPFYVAYYNPVHRDVLDESPMMRRLSKNTRWALYEASTSTLGEPDVPE